METIKIDGKDYEVIGKAEDGLPIIRGVATTTEDGVDSKGNPKRSVNINVPSITIGVVPGEVK
jgi:hypothetical protein